MILIAALIAMATLFPRADVQTAEMQIDHGPRL
jgi:hypothetical protein